ncbi:hypothetical protein KAU08_00050 [bacterium]|nr:hypothetical protein [bacterium]
MPRIEKDQISKVSKKTETVEDECITSNEHFELLISDKYKLLKPIPVQVHRYPDSVVVIDSPELNLYAQGDTEYLARMSFSEILIEQLDFLSKQEKSKLGRALQIQLVMLGDILVKTPANFGAL